MMDERLTIFFLGGLNDAEKLKLFREMEWNESLRDEFLKIQNQVALSRMLTELDDDQYAAEKFLQFKTGAKRHSYRLLRLQILKYAAVFLLLLSFYFTIDHFVIDQNEVHYTEIYVPAGQSRQLKLVDGTEVLLGSNSKITFPDKFVGEQRTVDLDGEAFFKVTKDNEKPFVVKTNRFNIKALGTTFNVYAYAESNDFETSLIKGSVCIYGKKEGLDKMYLQPDEKALITDGHLAKSKMSLSDVDYLNNGIYSFEEKTFGDVLERLEKHYGIECQVSNSSLLACSFTGKFKSEENIEDILTEIRQIQSFKYKRISENILEIY